MGVRMMALARVHRLTISLLVALTPVAAWSADTKPTPVETVTVVGSRINTPAAATLEMRGDDRYGGDFVAIWPKAAYRIRADGEVTLSCMVDVFGIAENCSVIAEQPVGLHFGDAAMEVRPLLKLKPAQDAAGNPIESAMNIVIRFKAPQTSFGSLNNTTSTSIPGQEDAFPPAIGLAVSGNPLQFRDVTMMNNPVWVQAATIDDVAHAYPAVAGNVEGYAVAHCMVADTGALEHCQIIKETPGRVGFKAAALSLTDKFRVKPELAQHTFSAPLWVDVPMRFAAPGTALTVTAPVWLVKFDPATTSAVFPQSAIAKGLSTGVGTVRCIVAADGTLSQCAPNGADPDGFSQAALQLAAVMRMNLWSADAAPVIGAQIVLPIEIKRK
jgi:hypothetical protein